MDKGANLSKVRYLYGNLGFGRTAGVPRLLPVRLRTIAPAMMRGFEQIVWL
jgi:hypothetical protein